VILADTSIWTDLLRTGNGAREAEDQITEHVTCGPLLQEVLKGLPEDSASYYFREAFLALPRLDDPLPVEAFLEAAEIYRSGRRRGYTIRSAVDCLIAAIAIRNGVTVWHKDRDYDTIARYTALRAVTQIR
jgi:predicted nucleic acid-binding protein